MRQIPKQNLTGMWRNGANLPEIRRGRCECGGLMIVSDLGIMAGGLWRACFNRFGPTHFSVSYQQIASVQDIEPSGTVANFATIWDITAKTILSKPIPKAAYTQNAEFPKG
jgi:hypothetical protein